MPIEKPYRRICRQRFAGRYSDDGDGDYVRHPKYAQSPEQYVRAFLVIQKDLLNLFDYVEPADANLDCYSYRTHELLLRACVEVEANCKAILSENRYSRSGEWNMGDYKKIEAASRLSGYEVAMPVWHGVRNIRRPFAAWAVGGKLPWYEAYHSTKHDRHNRFHLANFGSVLDAVCGLVALLSAQFITFDFSPGPNLLDLGGVADGRESAIGGYFRVKFPNNWPDDERYIFDWEAMKGEADPFQNFPF